MLYNSGYEWYMNKPLCENLQNIDQFKTVKFGVTEVEMSGSECKKKKTSLRNWPLKISNIKLHTF